MTYITALVAGIGCSLCNGISTVQQKVGADDTTTERAFNLMYLVRLMKNVPYVIGTLIAIIGYGLSLVSLQILPLFMVQSLVAASVVVTALCEQIFLRRRMDKQIYWSLFVVIVGVILLTVSAVSSRAEVHGHVAQLVVELCPIPLGILGAVFVSNRRKASAFILAAIGGLLFGNTSSVGRILTYPHPYWHLLENPLVYSLVLSAILGQYFFMVSLQRTLATKSNAIMIATQTLGPAILGLILFNDQIRSGFDLVVALGCVLVIAGSAGTAVDTPPPATI